MTAKPQPMAGKSEASDDLIAELAKLMAQDAHGDRPAEPAVPAFSVRIPGGEPAKASPVPRFDFSQPARPPVEPAQPVVPTPRPEPVIVPQAVDSPAPRAPEPEAPEPFRFDFDLGARREPEVVPAAPQIKAEAPPAPVAAAPEADPFDHDSIADLIAAELAVEPQPAPVPPTPLAPQMVAAPTPRPAPNPGNGWSPTNVNANLGGQGPQPRPALRAVNLQPLPKAEVPRSEQDRFKVPPVFGLGTSPAPAAPVQPTAPVFAEPAVDAPIQRAPAEPTFAAPQSSPTPAVQPADDQVGRDPIDEIESLIGRAMRVEFDKPEATPAVESRPAPSPALRSLATPVAPTTPAPPPRSAISSADEAILAAAHATGAQVGWVEAPEVDEPATAKRPRRERTGGGFRMSRAVAGPLVAVTLLLAAGFGLYWVLGLSRETGPAPLLTADATPVKETPAVQPDAAAPQQSVVFNEMDGVVPGADEQLVSRDQADVNEVTQVATPALSEEGLANRKVRTVTVRPDGTIVSGDDSVAGSAILPVDRPNVPAVPGAETASPALLASAEPAVATPAATPEPAAATVTPVAPGATVPAVDLAGNPIAGKTAVIPRQRPANLSQSAPSAAAQPTSPINAIIDAANAETPAVAASQPAIATAPQPATPAAQPSTIAGATEVAAVSNNAPAYVQLASQRSEAEARQTAANLVTRYGPLFAGQNMEVQRVDLGAKGIFYRVRVPANSAQEASSICTNVKAAGGDCFTM